MTKSDLKEYIDKFGEICAGDKGFKKTMHGKIREVDTAGNTCFIDNDDQMHIFTLKQIDSFVLQEFKVITEKTKEAMPPKKKVVKQTEHTFKVFFTKDDKEDYFIVEGETTEKVYQTALSVMSQRGLEYEKNQMYSQRIK
jgi:hypothetical protein